MYICIFKWERHKMFPRSVWQVSAMAEIIIKLKYTSVWQGHRAPAGRSTLPVLQLFCIKWHNSRHLLQNKGAGAATNQVKPPESPHYSIAQQSQTGIDRPSHSGVVADFDQNVPSFTWLRCTQITFQSHHVTLEFIGKSNWTQDMVEAFPIVAS